MMEERPIELDVISAEELKQVKWTGKMSPYAVAWIYSNHKVSTAACDQGGRNPRWNEKIQLMVEERKLSDSSSFLTIQVYHSGTFGPTLVGTAKIPLPEIAKGAKTGEVQHMAYQLRRPSGRAQGVITLGVKLGETRKVGGGANPSSYGQFESGKKHQQEPVTAYPAGYPPAGGAYPAPGQAYPAAQPYPPQHYPPQQQAYPPPQYGAYPPQNAYYGAPVPPAAYPPQRQRPSRFGGGGMGLGLGAGLLGGLLLGEALDNDCGYGGGDYGGGDYGGGDYGGGDFDGGDF